MTRLNTQQAADYIGVSYWTLVNWRKNNKGPDFLKLGGKIRYYMEDLNTFIAGSKKYAGK